MVQCKIFGCKFSFGSFKVIKKPQHSSVIVIVTTLIIVLPCIFSFKAYVQFLPLQVVFLSFLIFLSRILFLNMFFFFGLGFANPDGIRMPIFIASLFSPLPVLLI